MRQLRRYKFLQICILLGLLNVSCGHFRIKTPGGRPPTTSETMYVYGARGAETYDHARELVDAVLKPGVFGHVAFRKWRDADQRVTNAIRALDETITAYKEGTETREDVQKATDDMTKAVGEMIGVLSSLKGNDTIKASIHVAVILLFTVLDIVRPMK